MVDFFVCEKIFQQKGGLFFLYISKGVQMPTLAGARDELKNIWYGKAM